MTNYATHSILKLISQQAEYRLTYLTETLLTIRRLELIYIDVSLGVDRIYWNTRARYEARLQNEKHNYFPFNNGPKQKCLIT